jgi:hypothetical protein
MSSLGQWLRTAWRRPLSVRGHLIGLAFWLVLAALLAYRLLTADDDPGALFFLSAVAVLTNFAVLLLSYPCGGMSHSGAVRDRHTKPQTLPRKRLELDALFPCRTYGTPVPGTQTLSPGTFRAVRRGILRARSSG